MPDFALIRADPKPYLYVERRASMDPAEISVTIGAAFAEVMAFLERHGIPPAGPLMSVYYDYSEDSMAFRAGVFVAEDDMRAAQDAVRADRTPGGDVLHFTHVGPYETLRDSYAALMEHCAAEGLKIGAPTWEVYVDDPDTTPAERLRTEIYVTLA
jgi:effector-binding domain-containing protein